MQSSLVAVKFTDLGDCPGTFYSNYAIWCKEKKIKYEIK